MEDARHPGRFTTPVTEDKATRYHRLHRRAQIGALAATAALLAGLIGSGASVWLRDVALQAARAVPLPAAAGPAAAAVFYVTALLVIHESLAAPLTFYSGFVLERRYELSREPLAAWLRDQVKALLLGWAVGAVGAALLYAAMTRWPERWWIIATLGMGGVMTLLAMIAPVVLLPLFYRVTPLEREALAARLLALAARARTRVLGVHEWHLGDKTRKANAALVGLRHTRRILVSDTLLNQFNDDEIEVVLAHELAHHVHHDIWRGLAFETAQLAMSLWLADRALRAFGPALTLTGVADLAGLPLLLLVVGAGGLAVAPMANALSRAHERRADRFALDLTGNAPAFMSAMGRLAAQNLAEHEPSRLVEVFFHTHPPLRRRLAAAERWRAEQVAASAR